MSFERLLKPGSIAVFGGAEAREVIRQCDRMGFKGEIWPVHPRRTEVLGRRVYRHVNDLPGSPDASYIGVNRHLTIDIVRDLAARGAGGAICYASGFSEAGDEGAQLAQELLEASADMPLVGPNCYGLLNYVDGAMLWPDQQGGRRVGEGVAIITMSSNVGFNLTMQRRGLPIAYLVSLGNRMKFDLSEAVETLARQDRVTAIGIFMETIPDPAAFQAAVNRARELGKPIVALKSGRSRSARKIVMSHTASLAGSDVLVDRLFERLGVARVNSLESFVEALKILHVLGPLQGGRVGAMSTSGGDLILLADAMGPALRFPELSKKVREKLRAIVHERVETSNPLDYQMFTWNDEDQLARIFSTFLQDGFDVALCLLDYPRDDLCDPSSWLGAEKAFVRASGATGTPGAVLATFADTVSEPVAERLMEGGLVMLGGIDHGLAGVRAAVEIGTAWKRKPAPPIMAKPEHQAESAGRVLDEAESKQRLAVLGVPVPEGRVVSYASEAILAAEAIGFPVAIKALGITHKTEARGVQLNLHNSGEVSSAMDRMAGLSQSFLVEEMVQGVITELIVGVARDQQFGPYILVGSGGVLVEMMKDSMAILLPASREDVLTALGRLKCAPLLEGFRGAPAADLDAAVDVILAVARMVQDDPASVEELDINPLMLRAQGHGVVAVDALIRLAGAR